VREPPQPQKSFILLEDFTAVNMGAKSNNLQVLHKGLGSWINLPRSGCIPFKMLEYTLDLQTEIRDQIHRYIDKLAKTKSVKKMNRLLYRCKDLVMRIEFIPSDPMLSYLKQQLIVFGIQEKDFG